MSPKSSVLLTLVASAILAGSAALASAGEGVPATLRADLVRSRNASSSFGDLTGQMAAIALRAADNTEATACDLIHIDLITGESVSVATLDFCLGIGFNPVFPSASSYFPDRDEIVVCHPMMPSIVAVDVYTGATRVVAATPPEYNAGDQLIGGVNVAGLFFLIARSGVTVVDPAGGQPTKKIVEADWRVGRPAHPPARRLSALTLRNPRVPRGTCHFFAPHRRPMEEGAPATDGFSKIWIAQANTSDVWLVDIVDKTFEFAFTGQSLPRDMGFDAHTNDIVQMSNWKLVRTANEPPSRLPISLAPNRGVPNPHFVFSRLFSDELRAGRQAFCEPRLHPWRRRAALPSPAVPDRRPRRQLHIDCRLHEV